MALTLVSDGVFRNDDGTLFYVPSGTTLQEAQALQAQADPGPSVTQVAKAQCAQRIAAEVPQHTQMNLAHAKAQDVLSVADSAAYLDGYNWIVSMRAAWRTMEANSIDPTLDASWPAVPASLPDLVSRF